MSNKIYLAIITILIILTSILYTILSYTPPQNKKPFTILISREPDVFNALFMKKGISVLIHKALFRNLVERDDNLNLYPELVKEIPTIENGLVKIKNDGKMEVKWHFKTGLKWSDGHPLTPKDMIFTYKVLTHPDVPALGLEKEDAKYIHSMKITEDNNTIIVVWKKIYYNYLTPHLLLPKHILESPFLKSPKTFETLKYHRFPVGNGPYRLIKWVEGSYLLLEANPYYYMKPKIPLIAFKIVKDVNSLLVSLISGEGDACTFLTPDQFYFLKQRYNKQITTHQLKGMGWIHIDLNLDNLILKEKSVRQAILYAIDRDKISHVISHNTYQTAYSWLPPKHYAYHKPLTKYPYNPQKAKLLLNKSGWKLNSDNILEKNNKLLHLHIMTDSSDKNMQRLAIFIKQYLGEIGIKITIATHPIGVMISEFLRKRNFDMALYTWYMWPRVDGESYWSGNQIPARENSFIGLNFPGWNNNIINNIHSLLPGTITNKKRLELFKKHQDIWIEELPSLPLFITSSLSATRKSLFNWKPTGSAIPETWNCEYWELK